MERTKKILNISIAVSIFLCSLSLFIFSLNYNPAKSTNSKLENLIIDDGYSIVGVVTSYSSNYAAVIGYKATTKDIKILAEKKIDMNK